MTSIVFDGMIGGPCVLDLTRPTPRVEIATMSVASPLPSASPPSASPLPPSPVAPAPHQSLRGAPGCKGDHMTVREVSAFLRIGAEAVRLRQRKGKLPRCGKGKLILFDREVVEAAHEGRPAVALSRADADAMVAAAQKRVLR